MYSVHVRSILGIVYSTHISTAYRYTNCKPRILLGLFSILSKRNFNSFAQCQYMAFMAKLLFARISNAYIFIRNEQNQRRHSPICALRTQLYFHRTHHIWRRVVCWNFTAVWMRISTPLCCIKDDYRLRKKRCCLATRESHTVTLATWFTRFRTHLQRCISLTGVSVNLSTATIHRMEIARRHGDGA